MSKPDPCELFFIPKPDVTDEFRDGRRIYLGEGGQELLWSAKFYVPNIGDSCYITMNSIGPAIVKGYFTSYGGVIKGVPTWFLGVMTLSLDPPKWLRQQQKEAAKNPHKPKWLREGIGCEFGCEIELTKPERKVTEVKNV